MQVGGAADASKQAAAVELGGDGDGVGGFAAAVEVEDRVVDILMGGSVEVAGAKAFQNVGDGVLAQQHAAQHRLFCGQILWWLAGEIVSASGAVAEVDRGEIVDESHGPIHFLSDRAIGWSVAGGGGEGFMAAFLPTGGGAGGGARTARRGFGGTRRGRDR